MAKRASIFDSIVGTANSKVDEAIETAQELAEQAQAEAQDEPEAVVGSIINRISDTLSAKRERVASAIAVVKETRSTQKASIKALMDKLESAAQACATSRFDTALNRFESLNAELVKMTGDFNAYVSSLDSSLESATDNEEIICIEAKIYACKNISSRIDAAEHCLDTLKEKIDSANSESFSVSDLDEFTQVANYACDLILSAKVF